MKFQTKGEMIYQEFKSSILNGMYKPGQRIVISEIVKKFGTSTSPVREALKNLESEGLIKNIPHIGPVVTSINIEEIEKIFPIRIAVECLGAKLSTRKIKEKDLKKLRKIIEDIDELYSDKHYERVESLNRKFHQLIFSATENEYLIKSASDLRNLCFRSFKDPGIYTVMPEIIPELNQDHRNILKAMMSRDETQAERLTMKHMEQALEQMRIYYQSYKQEMK